MESFSLTYSRMVVSYSSYPESSVSNELSIQETSNTNKNNCQHKFGEPSSTLLGKSCSKKFKEMIALLIRFQMRLTKKTILSSKKEALKSTLNKFVTIDLAIIPIILIHIWKYFAQLWNKNKILMTLPMKASHSFEKLHFVWPENLQLFYS